MTSDVNNQISGKTGDVEIAAAKAAQAPSNKSAAVSGRNASKTPAPKGGKQPDWANGLRQLYDSVVEEPLPDSFADLLSQLDDKG